MIDTIAHRGPDGHGVATGGKLGGKAGLGHCRLSIIDLSEAGLQPMSNEDGTIWMVFNGEIYNFKEIRARLLERGHHFRSSMDGEVILHLYEDEGSESVRKLAGMFAYALWDSRKETLILCRDRVGIKPLVYSIRDNGVTFASEIKAILTDADVPRVTDHEALDLYLTLNFVPAPHTMFREIRKLHPGHYLEIRKGTVRDVRYWDPLPTSLPAAPHDFEEGKARLRETLNQAVISHLIADVPLGSFLSGGIDSSIITGLIARNSSRHVKTFTIGYPDNPGFDERSYARAVADFHQTDHHEILITSSDALNAIPAILDSFDEPFADSSAIPTFLVSRETRKEIKVVLSGDGGDELFAGYRMYTGEHWNRRYQGIPVFIRRRILAPLILALHDSRTSFLGEKVRRMKRFLSGAEGAFNERFFHLNELFSRDFRKEMLVSPGVVDSDNGFNLLSARLDAFAGDPVTRMLYAHFKDSLVEDMLRKVDLMSMLNSLEVRVPLLDHRVCELAFSMPGDWKLRGCRGKHILVETFKDLIPPTLLNRPKMGFEIPVSHWLKTDLRPMLDEYLSESRLRRGGIFNPAAVKRLTDDLMTGRRDTAWQLWTLLVFQSWHARHAS